MTMPYLMNCPHSGEGWCLECVKAEHDLSEEASVNAQLAILSDVMSLAKSMVQSIPCTCVTTMYGQAMCKRCTLLKFQQYTR